MVTGGPAEICTLLPYALCEMVPAWLGCCGFPCDRPNFGGLRTVKGQLGLIVEVTVSVVDCDDCFSPDRLAVPQDMRSHHFDNLLFVDKRCSKPNTDVHRVPLHLQQPYHGLLNAVLG